MTESQMPLRKTTGNQTEARAIKQLSIITLNGPSRNKHRPDDPKSHDVDHRGYNRRAMDETPP